MGATGRARKLRWLSLTRRTVQAAFLAFFIVLVFKAAYPPLSTPSSNIFLRFDPLAGFFSILAARNASVFVRYWPAWILLGLTLLGSRFFCGWICPLGTCFDAVGAIKPDAVKYYRPGGREMKERLARSREGTLPRRFRVKYVLLAVVLALALFGINLLYFASPLVVMNLSMYYILLPQIPVLFLILIIIALVYRPRFWCEEICPLGALLALFSMAGKRLWAKLSPLSIYKDSEACVSCGACYRDCPFGVEEPYIKQESGALRSGDCTSCGACVSACPAEGALALTSFGAKVCTSRGRRATERLSLPAPAAPEAHMGLTVTRREFVGSLGLGAVLATGYVIGLRDLSEPVLRMPGAQDESRFLAECNRCAECTRTCPVGCIKPMGLEDGFQRLWTPRLYPRTAGCLFDECNHACARVCPAGAIRYQKPEDVKIGLAHVNSRTCLGYRGRLCLVCMERCRFDAIKADGLRPIINTEKCTGCGACEQTCPTDPASIVVFPLGETPSWPPGAGRRRQSRK